VRLPGRPPIATVVEGILAGAQAAQGAGSAAHLGEDCPFDAAPAVKPDPAARQLCCLVQVAALEKMGVVGIVVGDIVEVIFLEDDVKGQRQAVGARALRRFRRPGR
jgi:hypothetical protein